MPGLKQEFKQRILAYIGGGFGLVTGLAWNEAIQALINFLFPLDRNSVWAKFLYALVMTAVVVIVLSYLGRLFWTPEEEPVSR